MEGAGASAGGTITRSAGPAAPPVTRRVRQGTLITLGGYGAGAALRLGGNLILTRLLFPEAFGLMAVVNSVLMGLTLMSDIGIGHSIVQSDRGEEPEYLGTAFTLQALRGMLLCLACAALAGPMAAFYAGSGAMSAELRFMLPVAGLTAVIDGLVSMRLFLARRQVRLGRITLLDLGTSTAALALMIVLAVQWRSVWALLIGSMARTALYVALSHVVLDGPRIRPRWDPASASALLRFGSWILVSTLLGFLAGQADRLVLGKLIPWGLLGVYGVAAVLAALPTEAFLKLAGTVVFPVLSRLRGDDAALRRAARQLRAPVVLGCGAVVSALLAGGGPALVALLYDDRWQAAGWMLQLLAAGSWFRTLDAVHFAMLQALGWNRAQAASNAVRAAGTFVLAGLGWMTSGFVGAIVGLTLADAAKYLATVLLVGGGRREAAWRGDVGPTLRVALAGATGWLVASWAAVGPLAGRPVLSGAAGACVALAFWALPAAAWLRERAAARPVPAPGAATIAGAAS